MTKPFAFSAGRVLLIDDDDLIAGGLRQYLALQGCMVDVAVECSSAEQLMRGAPYGVIVVDPFLTGAVHGLGTELIGAIERLQPGAKVMVVTGYGSRQLTALASGPRRSFHAKPQPVTTLGDFIFGALRAPQAS